MLGAILRTERSGQRRLWGRKATSRLGPFQCTHSLLDDCRRRRANVLNQGFEFLTADRIDLNTELFGICQEGGIFHGRQEARTQSRKAIGRHVRWAQEWASVNLLCHEKLQDSP